MKTGEYYKTFETIIRQSEMCFMWYAIRLATTINNSGVK
jgi:hypothetical protein